MTRLLLLAVLPVVAWASLGLWGLAIRGSASTGAQPVPLTRNLVFQAIAYGPIAFLVDWRKLGRRERRRSRKADLAASPSRDTDRAE